MRAAHFRRSDAVKLALGDKGFPRMVRRLLLAAAFLALAAPVGAQPKGDGIIEMPGRDPPPAASPRIRLFISPMGEPFHGPDGFGTWLSGADADHDGAVTAAEFRADGERFFHLLDTDRNGYIDGFEMQAYERERVPEIGGIGIDDGPRGGGMFRGRGGGRRGGAQRATGDKPEAVAPGAFRGAGREGAARFSLLNIPQPVANCDEDGDGRVSLAEWDRAAARRFAMLDKTQAGRITRDGLRPPPGADKPKR